VTERAITKAVYLTRPGGLESVGSWCDRLYFGHEFCPWLLPGRRSLERVREAAAARGLAFTLVTPVLGEEALAKAVRLLDILDTGAGDEVVANDMGLLEILAERSWKGEVVVGRVLTRQRRGAWWRGELPPGEGDSRYLRGSALDSPYFVEWLHENYGVRRFEIDNLVQGVEVGGLPARVRLSVHHPYLFLTATTLCPWTFDGNRWKRGEKCPSCEGEVLELTPDEGGRKILMAGGVQYLENDSADIYRGPAVDRLVRQPEL
jgi:hypothetical protein